MSLKDQLIKLGSEKPALRKHLRPVLDQMTKQARRPKRSFKDMADYLRQYEEGVASELLRNLPRDLVDRKPSVVKSDFVTTSATPSYDLLFESGGTEIRIAVSADVVDWELVGQVAVNGRLRKKVKADMDDVDDLARKAFSVVRDLI